MNFRYVRLPFWIGVQPTYPSKDLQYTASSTSQQCCPTNTGLLMTHPFSQRPTVAPGVTVFNICMQVQLCQLVTLNRDFHLVSDPRRVRSRTKLRTKGRDARSETEVGLTILSSLDVQSSRPPRFDYILLFILNQIPRLSWCGLAIYHKH